MPKQYEPWDWLFFRFFKITDISISKSHLLESVVSSSLFPFIVLPTRIATHSKTVIDNIFLDFYSSVIISGNLTASISNHLAQFIIMPDTKTQFIIMPDTKTQFIIMPDTKTQFIIMPDTKTQFIIMPDTKTQFIIMPDTKTQTSPESIVWRCFKNIKKTEFVKDISNVE